MKVREVGEEEWSDGSKYMNSWDYEDEENTAKRYAEYIFDQGYCDPSYFEFEVEVMNNDGEIKVFECCAEATVTFSASKKCGEEE